jgi:hypothetical protein
MRFSQPANNSLQPTAASLSVYDGWGRFAALWLRRHAVPGGCGGALTLASSHVIFDRMRQIISMSNLSYEARDFISTLALGTFAFLQFPTQERSQYEKHETQ